MYDKGVCLGYQKLTATVTAGQLTVSAFPQVEAALIRAETGAVRFTLDGTTPTTSSGYPIYATDTQGFWIFGAGPVKNFMAVATASTVVLDILYFGLKE